MGFIDRISRVIRANINDKVRQAEDPEKILEQAVTEMQANLVQLRQAAAVAIATQKRTERQAAQAQSTSEQWYRHAQVALQKGDEPLARDALTKRHAYQETAEALTSQIQQQSIVVNQLKQDMRSLELKMNEIRAKKAMYIARARSAEASVKLQELLGDTSSSINAFERMEEKVMQLEAQAEAIAITGTDDLEKKFLSLADSNDIDAEISQIKAQLANNTKELPGS
ncbi:PspA/IM30 family protein [Calothrix sp. 336/3]|uniref:PspA/IM30 family protein n=1 Tax=Calothrix sp. 336/3 TaxID=1337936 RepID=UPI0004E34E7B|nr:PspA/IM30 family protein [Calothrix sp. 336/3]AKG22825.1 phage-shock protein [Calothrix sp. 336/3]